MDRRAFLISSGGAAVAAASGTAVQGAVAHPAPTLKADATILTLAMPWADAPQGPADSLRRLLARLTTMTDGRIGFEVIGSSRDEADLWHGSAHDFATHHPAFAYFAGLPGRGGLGAKDFAAWLSVGGGQMLWDDLASEAGWLPLLAGHSGEAPPLWSTAPITRLADLAGRSVAVPGLGADVARALGAEPSPMAHGSVASALGEQSLDGAELGGLLMSLASGVARSTHHATGDGFNRFGTAHALNIRLAVWERLPAADRAIFAAAAAEAYHVAVAESDAHARLARQALEQSFGVQFASWPADIAEAIDRVAEATVAHLAAHDAVAARIDQSYMAFKAALRGGPSRRRPYIS